MEDDPGLNYIDDDSDATVESVPTHRSGHSHHSGVSLHSYHNERRDSSDSRVEKLLNTFTRAISPLTETLLKQASVIAQMQGTSIPPASLQLPTMPPRSIPGAFPATSPEKNAVIDNTHPSPGHAKPANEGTSHNGGPWTRRIHRRSPRYKFDFVAWSGSKRHGLIAVDATDSPRPAA
jgi:hypothetical protein